MVLSPTMTDATTVKYFLQGAGTGLSDTAINEMIIENEAFVCGVIKKKTGTDFTFSSDNLKHMLVRKLVNCMTALNVMAATPASFNTIDQLVFTGTELLHDYDEIMKNFEPMGWDWLFE
jgi:hypothetical protein